MSEDIGSASTNNSVSENITLAHESLDKNHKWSHVAVMCLLEILWEQFETAKVSLTPRRLIFENTAREMSKNGFKYSKNDVQKKYANMMQTYRRIKTNMGFSKNSEKLTWPYYQIMKEIREKDFDSRVPVEARVSPPLKRMFDSDSNVSTVGRISSTLDDLYPSSKREKLLSDNLSCQSGGMAVKSDVDIVAFSNKWEEKRFALEDFKMQLIETLFKDAKQQRVEVEEDALNHLQMRHARNKHLKEIVSEMSQLRTEVKRELTSLSESINDLISAIRSTAA